MNSQFDPGEWLEGLLGFFNAAIRGFLPRMILAIAALMLGWLVAVLVRRLLRSVLRWMKVDQVYDRSGMKMAMEKTGVRGSLVS
nr:hypothetical protein [bacterium]